LTHTQIRSCMFISVSTTSSAV